MDAVGVQMITLVREFSSLAGGSDSILCPTEEHSDLSNVEWPRAVLEHLWNTTAVHGWGSLVRICLPSVELKRFPSSPMTLASGCETTSRRLSTPSPTCRAMLLAVRLGCDR